ncbi:dienelactone hydrolase family protein [Emcibacter nanhaiensis]|uniref:Alpha/beta hydrolase n=1 Tax=Emcibacter nanhaiensis TaxID=1505037 RepID=A0A501PEK9_9PROT|nr:alpha/beta hydrolase [Emcibacter nanhaiensis]TPD58879.1 alpha/beta hydrolase [Emcibacter nanhaiensis]
MTIERQEIRITPPGLDGFLILPDNARGLVLFAHGSGSSRFSSRNNYVAEGLQNAGIATLLFDLLTEEEAADRSNVFDIPFLTQRLVTATDWAAEQGSLKNLPLGYFGASTGAAAALMAEAGTDRPIRAIVSRGGRPDLAADVLAQTKAPTLLIVGGDDFGVIELNEQAYAALNCEKALEIVPHATHLFEEPGALDQVIELAREWFIQHL